MKRLFIFILFFSINVNAQRIHILDLSYSYNNYGLTKVSEDRKLVQNGLLESQELVEDSIVTIFNKIIESKLNLNLFGIFLRSSIPIDSQQAYVLSYGIGGGIHKSNLEHIFADTTFLGYKNNTISPCFKAGFDFTYQMKSGFFIFTSFNYLYLYGESNDVIDLEFGVNHPSFSEKHDNKYHFNLFSAGLNAGYKKEKIKLWFGSSYTLINTKYEIHRIITDLDWNDVTEELIEYKYENAYPINFSLGTSYCLTSFLALNTTIRYDKYLSILTSFSIKF